MDASITELNADGEGQLRRTRPVALDNVEMLLEDFLDNADRTCFAQLRALVTT